MTVSIELRHEYRHMLLQLRLGRRWYALV